MELFRRLSAFYGEATNALAVVGELFERHAAVAGGWIPFQRYLNFGTLSELIAGRYGMLADGPASLVLTYEEVVQRHGFSTSHHPSKPPAEASLSTLIFDESFVIAENFEAVAL